MQRSRGPVGESARLCDRVLVIAAGFATAGSVGNVRMSVYKGVYGGDREHSGTRL